MAVQLVFMCALMGASSFACGMLPLAIAFSRNHIERLSAVGTGLLLGAALGIIIPEGIETTVEAKGSGEVPTTTISLALLAGFTLMLFVEQLGIGHSHGGHDAAGFPKSNQASAPNDIEFDAELDELERDGSGHASVALPITPITSGAIPGRERALPLTLGLVIHGFADGLALGVSSLSSNEREGTSTLSLVVFLALILHKAPTALALTTSLLASSLPRADCKKYLAVFAASTPFSAVICYLAFSLLGSSGNNDWTGVALLFSGGTFLYVATVLQPISHHSSGVPDLPRLSRVLLIVIGLFIPFLLSLFMGHGH